MAVEPSPSFRWIVLKRLSQYNTKRMAHRPSEPFEESTTRQEVDVVRHIKANNLGVVVATYSDIASGWDEKAKRPGFEAALEDLKAGRADGIACWKLDRLVRRVSQFRRVIDALESSGGRLLSVTEGIDTADPDRKFVNGIIMDLLARLAEMESDNHSVRTAAWHAHRAERGLVQRNGHRPFGHTDDLLGLVKEEVALIHEAKERIFEGQSASSIARLWTERGIPTRSGNPWHHDTILYILTHPRMVAQREHGETLYDLEDVPAIFEDREEWERLCAIINTNRRKVGRREWYLCSNIATCSLCARPLISATSGDGEMAYGCRKRRKEPGACGRIWIGRGYLDELVTREALTFLSDRERIMGVLRSRETGTDMEALHKRMNELSDSMVALASALNPPPGVPRMPLPVYYEQVAAIEDERKGLERRMGVNREASLLVEALDFGEGAAEVWAERGVNYQRQILKLICKRVEVRPGRVVRTKGKQGNSFDPERVRVTFADE
jgi:DNA invertase Pin-like site-specific DNA recombinase